MKIKSLKLIKYMFNKNEFGLYYFTKCQAVYYLYTI